MSTRFKIKIAQGYDKYSNYIAEIPERFGRGEGTVIYDGRNSIHRLECDGHAFVVKRFRKVNFVQRVAYTFFRPTKAKRAFLFAKIFRDTGIATPHEVAYIEEYPGGFFTTGYFVSEECQDPPAFPALVPNPDYDKLLASDLAGLIARMHMKGILHGDLNFGNFLYRKEGNHYHFTVIDTNRSHFCHGVPTKEQCLYNLRTMTQRRDLYEFMAGEYAKCRGWDEAEIRKEALEYLDRFLKKQERKWKLKNLIRKL